MAKAPPTRTRSRAAQAPPPPAPLPLGRKLLFSAIVVLGTLALLEAGARLLVTAAPNSRFAFHRQLVDSVGFPALNEVLAPDPVLFWSLRPNLDNQRLAGRIAAASDVRFTVSTDARGTRRMPAVAGAPRLVAFLGDSCTFGVGVNDDQTFAALVEQRMPALQSLNLGVPGYTAYQGRLQVMRFPFAAAPAAMVITFGFNDAAVWDNRSDLEQAQEVARQESWVYRSRLITALGGLLRPPPAATTGPPAGTTGAAATRRPRLTDDEYTAEIRAIVEWCRARGTRPVLLLWPYKAQLTRTDWSPKQRALMRLAAADKLPLVNLVPDFRARGGERLFLDLIHATADGHAVVADALLPVLAETLSSAR